MTAPGQSNNPPPQGSYVFPYGPGPDNPTLGTQAVSHAQADWNQTTIESTLKTPTIDKFTNAQTQHQNVVITPLAAATGTANTALTNSQAAVNTAASADSTAASASARASYWEAEFVVASAAVVLGTNELLIGLCQNVPGGLTRTITDMHVALLTQPNGMNFDLHKLSSTGTTDTTLGSYSLAAGVNRANWANLGFGVVSKERVYINVTSVTGSTAPTVLQVLLFGVMQ